MRYKAVVFDFDGTICDTGEGIMKSVKYALDDYNIDSPDWNELSFFIGPPLLVSFQERFNVSADLAGELVEKFRERYAEKGVFECSLYSGITELLKSLKNHGVKIGIASSKPQVFIEKILDKFQIKHYFDCIAGVTFNADCESKASIISRCVKELGEDKKDVIVAGDRKFDIDGASALLIDSCAVLWGYGSKFEFIEHGATFIAEKVQDVEAVALGFFEQTQEVKPYLDGRIINVHVDTVMMCNKTMAQRETVDHPGGVAVCAVDNESNVLLVRQFRYPYKEIIYEIPAGKLERGENPEKAAVREFEEECGAVAGKFFSLGELYPTPGYCAEIIRMYGAEDITYTDQNLDEDEFLEVVKIPLAECVKMVMSGEIKDSKTIAAIMKMNYLKSNK